MNFNFLKNKKELLIICNSMIFSVMFFLLLFLVEEFYVFLIFAILTIVPIGVIFGHWFNSWIIWCPWYAFFVYKFESLGGSVFGFLGILIALNSIWLFCKEYNTKKKNIKS